MGLRKRPPSPEISRLEAQRADVAAQVQEA
jgi:hypothetical protein